MSAHKYIIAMTFMVLAVITISTASINSNYYAVNNKSHHLIVGYRMPGDRLVTRENIVKNSSWMKVVIVEKTFNTTRNDRITMVQALDQKTNGNGAFASIVRGGPGHVNVTMKFKSQRGHGINFIMEVYARP